MQVISLIQARTKPDSPAPITVKSVKLAGHVLTD
jgi:hypothetical protein